jgi:hypothetical protein
VVVLFVTFWVGIVQDLTWLQMVALVLMFFHESYLDFARIRSFKNEPQT